MTRTRAVTLTALVAASSLLFAACSSSPGQQASSATSAPTGGSSASSAPSASGAATSGAATSGAATSGPATSGPATSGPAASSGAKSSTGTSAAGGADGCGKPHGAYTDSGAAAGSITTGSAELASSWNNETTHGNSVYNANPAYLTQAQMFYYDHDLNVVNNGSFITCSVTAKSPLTIKYTINKAAKWSDGIPITADDLLLQWIAKSGKFNSGTLNTDKDGNITGTTGVAFDAADPGAALITTMPEMSADGTTMTVVYSKPFVDYQLEFGPALLPAHVVGEKALGMTDPTAATKALVAAAKANDKTALKKIADFWNTGFDFTQLPTDKALYLSSGAYLMTDFKKDQYMTFKANPAYTWGPKPTVATITYEFLPDATAAVQAVQNQEVAIIEPEHPTTNLTKGLAALAAQGVKAVNSVSGSWEHVDLVFTNGGPFDPKTYGGDAEKAKDVRLAFLKTVPRQEIVDRLIKPIDPKAAIRESFTTVPGSPSYAAIVAQNGMTAYDKVDIAGAKALLAKAGVANPKVRFLYSSTNPVRAQEYQLISASAKLAGITVVDGKDPNWSSNLPNIKKYDASVFGWINTNLGIAQQPPNFLGKVGGKWVGANNYGQYNNETVNKWMNTLNVTTDPATQNKLLQETEKQLVADGFGTILYQTPDIVGFDSTKVTGVSTIPVSPGVFWNFFEWKLAS